MTMHYYIRHYSNTNFNLPASVWSNARFLCCVVPADYDDLIAPRDPVVPTAGTGDYRAAVCLRQRRRDGRSRQTNREPLVQPGSVGHLYH